MGPSVVVLVQPGHWTLGALVNNAWSVAGSGGCTAVNLITLQYVWVVPFGGGVGRIMKLGFQPVNLTAQFYGNAAYPTHGSPWGMRLQLAFLFPRLNKEEEKALLEKPLKDLEGQSPQKQ
jgi:hypothetical protein